MKHEKRNLKNYLKMKDLKEKTGLSSSTINYYLRNGLLPEPVKTGRNMAWYQPSTITRLNLIKKLQEKNRLSISEISEIINSNKTPDDLYVMESLHDFLFSEMHSENVYEKEEFLKLSGLEEERLDDLIEKKIIFQCGEFFDDLDLFIAKAMAKGFRIGLDIEDLSFYLEAAEIISVNEMRIRKKLTKNLSADENAEITYELTDVARKLRIYLFERAFQEQVLGRRKRKS